jgi:hypothetical protein
MIGFHLNNPDTLFGYLRILIRLTNLIPLPSKNVCQQKHSVFRETFSVPRYLQLRHILLNQLNFVQSRVHSDFRVPDEPVNVDRSW